MRLARAEAEEATLGLAPLIDVVLLLLIFFLVTTSFAERRIPLQLPEASNAAPSEAAKIRVTLAEDGQVYIDERPASIDALDRLLGRSAAQSPDLEIRADQDVRHGRVVEVLGLATRHGIASVGIAVAEPAGQEQGEGRP